MPTFTKDPEKIRIKFLGSGSAFTLASENFQSNVLISKELHPLSNVPCTEEEFEEVMKPSESPYYKHLLYDCGTTIPEALNEANLKPQDLAAIYISHLHADHAGGIEYIGFKTYFEVFNFGKTEFGTMRPKLYGHKSILYNGWDGTWKGGLQSIQGQVNSLESYFDTHYMESNDDFDFYGVSIKPVQTVHVVDDRMINPSYGIMIQNRDADRSGTIYGPKVFLTGDSQFAPNQMLTYFKQADMIFHDCEFAEYPNSVHAQFHQLKTLDEETKAKMWLYHYSLGNQTFEEVQEVVLFAGFAGLVKKGQEFYV